MTAEDKINVCKAMMRDIGSNVVTGLCVSFEWAMVEVMRIRTSRTQMESIFPELYAYKPIGAPFNDFWFPLEGGKQIRLTILKDIIHQLEPKKCRFGLGIIQLFQRITRIFRTQKS